jgi:tape measure domain-containing protein
MKFDNAGFQEKVSATQKNLEGLKQSLNFTGTGASLADIQTGLNRINLGPLSVAVDGVSTKFLALATAGVAALGTIVSKATSAGAQIVKSLAITPILDGYREYETNMTSIQTILANTKSKGSNLADVNRALDELNEYSDKTIYNFGEMTKNIGTFTAAGVDLDKSVLSIKGIANLAALSGSNSQQASTAMYQLSQSIASGSVKLMDWNSVVNAGMGGEVFQKALFETGKQMKTIAGVPMDMTFEQWTKAGNTFRGSLEKGWLTADVLTTTLSAFTGDLDAAQLKAAGYTDQQVKDMMMLAETAKAAATDVKTATQLVQVVKESIGSGWSQSFRTIVGDFEESKKLFSGLYGYFNGIIGNSAEARNNLLAGWKAFGGRDTLVQALTLGLNALQTAVAPIRLAFREFFPKTTALQLINFTNGIRDLMLRLTAGQGTVNTIYRIFSTFFSTLKVGWIIIKGLFSILSSIFGVFGSVVGEVLRVTSVFGGGITDLNKKLISGGLSSIFEKISSAISGFGNIVISILSPAVDKIIILINAARSSIGDFLSILDDMLGAGGKLTAGFEKIKSFFANLFPKDTADSAKNVTDSVGIVEKALGKLGAVGDYLQKMWDKIVSAFSGAGQQLAGVGDFFVSAWEAVVAVFNSASRAISNAIDSVKNVVKELWDGIAAAFSSDAFSNVTKGVSVGFLGGLLFYFRKFVNEGLNFNISTGLLDSVKEAIGAFTGKLEAMQNNIKADTLMKIAKAVAVLTASVVVLAFIDSKKLAAAMTAIVAGFAALVGTMQAINKVGLAGGKLIALAVGLTFLSTAILVLSIAMKIMSTLSWGEIARGLVGLAGVLYLIIGAANALENETADMIQASIAIIAISIAIRILAVAVGAFAAMSWKEIGTGLAGVAGSLALVIAAMKLMPKDGESKAATIIALALAIKVVANVVEQFGSMDTKTIVQGLLGVAATLAIIVIAIRSFPKEMLKIGGQLIAISIAIGIMALSVALLGTIGVEKLITGVLGIAVMLGILAVAANLMSGSLAGAAAIVILSGAMWVLSRVIIELAKLSLKEVGIAILALAAALAVLGLMAFVLQPVIPAIVALGVGLMALGLAFALVGAGAYLVAEAFKIFAEAGTKGLTVFSGMLAAIGGALPAIIEGFVIGLISGLTRILQAAPALVGAIVKIFGAILDGIITILPKVGKLFGELIDLIAQIVIEKAPIIVLAGLSLLQSLLDGIKQKIPELVTTVGDIIVTFLDTLSEQLDDIIDAGANLIVSLLKGIAENMKKVIDAGTIVVVAMLNGISKNVTTLITAGANLIISIMKGIGDNLDRIITEGVKVILKFLDGIQRNLFLIINAGWNLVLSILDGLTNSIRTNAPIFRQKAKELVEAIIEGFGFDLKQIKRIKDAMLKPFTAAWDGVKNLFGWNSPAKAATDLAGGLAEGLQLGLKQNTRSSVTDMERYGYKVKTALEKSISDANLKMSGISNFNPVIAPVLDLSGVRSEASKLDGILGTSAISAAVSYDQASVVSALSEQVAALTSAPTTTSPTEIRFEQNNYSPEALSVNDIYRQTRSQIELAKQELNVS